MQQLKPPSKLFQKVLVLVTIPLAFQLLFLLSLSMMLDQAEREVKRESCARSLLMHVRVLTKALTSGAAIGYNTISGKLFLERFNSAIAPIPSELKELERLGGLTSQQSQEFQSFGKLVEELQGKCTEGQSLLNVGQVDKGTAVLDSLTGSMAKVWTESETLLRDVKKLQDENPVIQTQMRQSLRLMLWIGAAANVLLVLGLATVFYRGTAARLAKLMENTVRLAKKQPLHAPSGGGDEIAKLDEFFHEMAGELEELDIKKRDFVSMLTHDMRSPLTSLRLTLEMLAEGTFGQLTEQGKQVVMRSNGTTGRLVTMINNLLDIEKLEAGMLKFDMKPVSLSKVIEQSVDSVRGMAMQQYLTIEVPAVDEVVWGDSERLTEVVTNLISNAIKYSPKAGKITITTTKHESSVEIAITDQGPGIAPKHQAAIFDQFFQIEEGPRKKTMGTGLGLAICKRLIEAHDGLIGVRSEQGTGSTFWIRIPIHTGQSQLPEEDSPSLSETAP